ncbi:transposase zinc-binding domain-containing protein [Serratia sp. CY85251]
MISTKATRNKMSHVAFCDDSVFSEDMGVRRYCCASSDCTHARFFCQSCNSKACSNCGLRTIEQWIVEQQHITLCFLFKSLMVIFPTPWGELLCS